MSYQYHGFIPQNIAPKGTKKIGVYDGRRARNSTAQESHWRFWTLCIRKVNTMTLDELEKLDKEMLVPADIAPILGCSPYSINVVTRDGKNPFPFPIIRMGTRVRIPKKPFIKAIRGEEIKNEV